MANVYYTSNELYMQVGAAALRRDELTDLKDFEDMFVSDRQRQEFNEMHPATAIIIVSNTLAATLSSRHLKAIIAHEQEHINCGHINRSQEVCASGFIDNMGYEIQADYGAALVCGPSVMRKALLATCVIIVETLCKKHNVPENEKSVIFRKVYKSIKPRLDVLRSLEKETK